MIYQSVTDWDDAYANAANIPHGDRWPEAWVEPAERYRQRMMEAGRARLDVPYGPATRNRLDLFLPDGDPKGLVVFVHGGYWMRLDRSFWSHLADGAIAHGHAVVMPSYTLCPDIRIAGIVEEIGAAITKAAGMIDGPIRLSGHSAGGHLVTRMVCASSPLAASVRDRIVNTVSISGVHDLRPLMRTRLNDTLGIHPDEARAESPVLLEPMPGARLCCWVGANERSEFVRQNALLASIWTGLGATTMAVAEPDRHHFSVIDGLANPLHALTTTLLTG